MTVIFTVVASAYAEATFTASFTSAKPSLSANVITGIANASQKRTNPVIFSAEALSVIPPFVATIPTTVPAILPRPVTACSPYAFLRFIKVSLSTTCFTRQPALSSGSSASVIGGTLRLLEGSRVISSFVFSIASFVFFAVMWLIPDFSAHSAEEFSPVQSHFGSDPPDPAISFLPEKRILFSLPVPVCFRRTDRTGLLPLLNFSRTAGKSSSSVCFLPDLLRFV